MAERVKNARRIVVKVGSSLVTDQGHGVDAQAIGQWCRQIAVLAGKGCEVIVVSSGAIAEGMSRLGWATRPRQTHKLQAAAAVGQMGLVQTYESQLREHGVRSAQVLLTRADLEDRERYLNARSTLMTLLGLKVVPVINENDTVANDEIKFGDNDTLGALVVNLVEADALVVLTDQMGLYSSDPRHDSGAKLISQAHAGAAELERMAGGAGTRVGSGGMLTKVLAAKRAANSGASTVIVSGREPDVLLRLASGEAIGTTLLASTQKLTARKQWMADHLHLYAAVVVDDGVIAKLCEQGKSLLPVGMVSVEGEFARGEVIAVRSRAGVELARGLANYNSTEARMISGKPSSEFERLLGFAGESEMIHRDNLVLA